MYQMNPEIQTGTTPCKAMETILRIFFSQEFDFIQSTESTRVLLTNNEKPKLEKRHSKITSILIYLEISGPIHSQQNHNHQSVFDSWLNQHLPHSVYYQVGNFLWIAFPAHLFPFPLLLLVGSNYRQKNNCFHLACFLEEKPQVQHSHFS